VIECASVEGKVFHRGAVLELAPEALRVEVPTHLLTLQRKELIRPSSSDFAGDDAFRFRHLLIRDAAYDALPKQLRAELHERFAGWLERAAGERAREYEEILGYHLEQAYRYRAELGPIDEHARRLASLASEWLAGAARRARSRDDLNAARSLLERAVALYPPDDERRLALLPDLGELVGEQGEYEAAETILTEAIERADDVGDRLPAAHARVALVGMRLFSDPEGRGDEALRVGEEAIRTFRELGDDRGVAVTAMRLHWVRFQRGQLKATAEQLEAALPYAVRAGDVPLEGYIRLAIAGNNFWGPSPLEDAEREIDRNVDWLGKHGLRLQECRGLRTLAVATAMQGRLAEGRDLMDQARALSADIGVTPLNVMNEAEWVGQLEQLAGDYGAAERVQRRGYDVLESYGEMGFRSTLAGELAQTLYYLGRYDEAASFAEESRKAAASDDVMSQALWRGVNAKVLARKGEHEEAERLAREAVQITGNTELVDGQAMTLSDLAEVLRLADRPEEAATALHEALELYEQKGNVVLADRTRERLAGLGTA
jgi:tetratricopeptide (TPR) repeat protein